MRKILIFVLVLLIIPFSLSALDQNTQDQTEEKKNPTASLNLIIPDNTLSFGFSDTSTGTTLSSTPLFYLWKYDVLSGVSTEAHVTTTPYVLAKTEFYVWYDAFVGDTVKLVIETPAAFSGSDKISSIPVATSTTSGMADVDGATLLEGDSAVTVASLDGHRIYKGWKKYYVVLDIMDAREGVTYTGEIKLKVEAGS